MSLRERSPSGAINVASVSPGLRRWAAIVLLSALSAGAVASEPLPGDMIQDLNRLQSQLASQPSGSPDTEALNRIIGHARAQSERLASGNRADQWASALYHQLAASALARQGEYSAAADELTRARQRPSAPDSQRRRWLRDEASLRRAAGERDAAIELYAQWLSASQGSDRDDETAWQLVRLLAEEERWEAAMEWLAPLLERAQLTADQQALVNVVLRHAGRNEEALSWLLDGLRAESDPAAWRQAAGLAQRAGQLGVAAAVWEAAWQLGKFSTPEERLTLIELHMAGGTPARAAEHLEAALEAGTLPRDEATLRLRATAWQQARHVVNALSAWRALAEWTQSADDWRQYGQLAYGWGDDEQAKAALAEAAERGDAQAEQWLANFE